jgi:hypothetical protein
VDVVNVLTGPTGIVPATFDVNQVTVKVPLAFLGGDDGRVNAAALVGNLAGPTDCVPNRGFAGTYRVYLPLEIR